MAPSKTIPVFLWCILALAAMTPTSPVATPALKIAVNTTTIESFPVFAAADSMSANGEASKIEVVPVPNGRVAMSQLASAAADAATGSETQVLLNSVMEPGLRIIVTLAECRYRIVARRSRASAASPISRAKR